VRDQRGRLVLLVSKLGMMVDVMADLAQRGGCGHQVVDFGEADIGGHQAGSC
jgi:hypothetical protein